MKKISFNKAKDAKTSKSNKAISSFALMGIAILAIFSFGNIVDNYTGLGLSSVVAFIIATVVYLLPFAFIIAELATIKFRAKSNSGLTNWVNSCIGRKTAFITAYMFWFANLFYFVGAVPNRLNYVAFGFTGADYTKDPTFNLVVPFVAVALFAIITLISTLNTRKISKFTNVSAWTIMGLTGLFFYVAIIAWIGGAINPALLSNTEAPGLIPNDDLDLWGDAGGINFVWMSTFIWVLMAADGAQSLGVYVNDVKGGSKKFSKAIMISILLIGFTYIIGTLLVTVFPPKIEGEGSLANNLVNSYFNMFYFIFQGLVDPVIIQRVTYVFIGLCYTFTLGSILIWTSAPVRAFFSEIPTGVFGSSLPKQNRNGAPTRGAWIQFILVAPLLLIPALGIGDISDFFRFIKSASGWIGMIPPLIIFLAYFNLRLRKDKMERSFKMGNRTFGLIVSGFMIVVFLAIMVVTFLEAPFELPYEKWDAGWWLSAVYKVGCFLVLVLPVYLWYLRYERMVRDSQIAYNLGINEKFILYKYSFSKKIKKTFMMDLVNWKTLKINELDKKYDEIFKNIDYEKKESKNIYTEYKFEYAKELRKIKRIYKRKLAMRKRAIKAQIRKAYAMMRPELMKFRSDKKYAKKFMEKCFEKEKYFQFEIESNIKPLENLVYSTGAIKRSPTFFSKNILDKISITNNEIIIHYLVNNEYQKINFDLKKSAVIFSEDSKEISRFNKGEEIKLNLVQLVSTKDNNVWDEDVYIENFHEFRKHYLQVSKNLNANKIQGQ